MKAPAPAATLQAANGLVLLTFSARPPATVLETIKATGYRWDEYCAGWCMKDTAKARAVAAPFLRSAAALPADPAPVDVSRRQAPAAPPVAPPVADPQARAAADQAARADLAARFREKADQLAARAAQLQRPMTQNFTPKRNREYLSRCHDGRNLDRAAQLLRALADLTDANRVPPELANLSPTRWKAAAELVEIPRDPNCGYYECRSADDYRRTDPVARFAQSLIDGPTAAQKTAALIAEKESRLRRDPSCDGFFPTPRPVADRLAARLFLRPGSRILEPSAGIGTLCEAVRDVCPTAEIVTVERLFDCRDILELKGFAPAGRDFLVYHDASGFDAVVMNPPFENLADCDHVRHAFDLLRPGGRLVAIMSPAWQYRDTRKATQFRDWFADVSGSTYELAPGWCDVPEAFRRTKVAALIVTIDKE